MLHRRAAEQKIPLSGTFELSPVCNFSCRMCYVRKTPAQISREGKALLTVSDWLSMAEQCKQAGTLSLLLTGGEPFLYPGFRELYTALHQMGFLLSVNTNGTLIDEETLLWLKQYAPARVNLTLYGASRETYEKICGDPAGYDRAMAALTLLRDAGIPTVINASMIPENAHEPEKILSIGRELGLNVRMGTYMFPPARREREEGDSRFTPEQGAEIFLRKAKALRAPEDYRNWLFHCTAPQITESEADWGHAPEQMRCRAGRSSFWINWEGEMTACGLMDFPLKTAPFAGGFLPCWLKLTDAVRSATVLEGCAGCPNRELCSPCAAMLHAETGSANIAAPYLCETTRHILSRMESERKEMAP